MRKIYYAKKRMTAKIIITFTYPCNGRERAVLKLNFRAGDFDSFTRYDVP